MRKTFSASDQNGDALLGTMTSSVPLVEQALLRLETAPLDGEALEVMYSHAHTIGRTASLMECPALAQLAHGMEGTLADVLEGFARLDPPTLILLRQTLGTMQALLNQLYAISSGANGYSPTFNGREAERAGLVVEATISETDPARVTNHRGGSTRSTKEARLPEERRRPSWWPKPRAVDTSGGRVAVEGSQRIPLGAGREQGAAEAVRRAEASATPTGPRPQEQQARASIDLIRALQQQRKTGRLTLRRGSGATAEEGWIQFELGQITRAASGRHRDAEARNWLSTWGSCRYLFEEAGPSP
jgi:chemotaxis protein histidine kinase CheA